MLKSSQFFTLLQSVQKFKIRNKWGVVTERLEEFKKEGNWKNTVEKSANEIDPLHVVPSSNK